MCAKTDHLIGVTSRSFSQHPVLRAELLEKYKHVRFNDTGAILQNDSLITFAQGCKKLITALEKIDDYLLSKLPDLEVISKYGVGVDMLDIDALIKHQIKLGWTGGVNKRSVAELALAFMISILRKVPQANLRLRQGIWENHKGSLLTGKTAGIIGCGNVGKDLAVLLRAFDCEVLAYDIQDYADFYLTHSIQPVQLTELLQRSDIVTLHLPLDKNTNNFLNAERLQMMKSGSILINTARGSLIDEHFLKKMLIQNHIAGAGFDVFIDEPPEDLELICLENFLATPHIGGSSAEAILAMGRAAIRGLDENAVPGAGYPFPGN